MTKKEQFKAICRELRSNIRNLKYYKNKEDYDMVYFEKVELVGQLSMLRALDLISSENAYKLHKCIIDM